MRFHRMFLRSKPSGAHPTLGADAVPTGAPTEPLPDNMLSIAFRDINGWPVHRIAMAFKGSVAPGANLAATAWVWDGLSETWYQLGPAAVVLEPNRIAFFDFLGVPEFPGVVATRIDASGNLPSVGRAAEVVFIVTDPNGVADGDYTFVIAPDLTTIGYDQS